MKRLFSIIFVLTIIFLCAPQIMAAGISANLGGPGSIKSGETLTVNLSINGSNIKVVQGEITFDAGQLEYKSNGGILNGWKVDMSQSGGKLSFLAEDDKLTAPINGSKQLCTLSFTVKAGAGSNVSLKTSNISATDGNSDFTAGNTSYSVTVATPPSGNTTLKH